MEKQLGYGELGYEIDNRDAGETWLQISDRDGKHLGHIRLMLSDMFGLIHNVMDNSEGMDTSDIENGIDELIKRVYEGIPRKEEGGASPAEEMVDRGALDS